MRRAAWNVATVLYCVFCALVNLAAAQTPQLCADLETTSTGTENYARMCGVNANAACEATASSVLASQYIASIAVDGVLSSDGTDLELAFISQNEIGWWRVDFGITRGVQRVYLRNPWSSSNWGYMRNIVIRVGTPPTPSRRTHRASCATRATPRLSWPTHAPRVPPVNTKWRLETKIV